MKSFPNFARSLHCWYKKNARPLPWRETLDPYRIWISEIMLQQTTVNTVIAYYSNWMKSFPTVEKVAKARQSRILKIWQGLGYYQRAKNVHAAAKKIVQQYHGQIPKSKDELKALPGFGPYTTGAVLSIAYDRREPIIDTNVKRLVLRLLGEHKSSAKNKKILVFLDQVMPKTNLRTFNQALMELGALVCKSKNPSCGQCPVRRHCESYAKGIQKIIPSKQKKKNIIAVEAVAAVISKGDKIFIQKRPSTGLLADMWEFPGGKIERNETNQQALKREVAEEIHCQVLQARRLMSIRHTYTHYRVHLHIYLCQVEPLPKTMKNRLWVPLKKLHHYPMPSTNAKIITKLRQI